MVERSVNLTANGTSLNDNSTKTGNNTEDVKKNETEKADDSESLLEKAGIRILRRREANKTDDEQSDDVKQADDVLEDSADDGADILDDVSSLNEDEWILSWFNVYSIIFVMMNFILCVVKWKYKIFSILNGLEKIWHFSWVIGEDADGVFSSATECTLHFVLLVVTLDPESVGVDRDDMATGATNVWKLQLFEISLWIWNRIWIFTLKGDAFGFFLVWYYFIGHFEAFNVFALVALLKVSHVGSRICAQPLL